MRGHEGIINLRRQHLKPETVFINDWVTPTDWEQFGDYPNVCVAGDDPESLDLRFLVGLDVIIGGSTEDRAKAFFEAAVGAGAKLVASSYTFTPPGKDYTSAQGVTFLYREGERSEHR